MTAWKTWLNPAQRQEETINVSGSASAGVLPMNDAERAAAASAPKHPLGFAPPASKAER